MTSARSGFRPEKPNSESRRFFALFFDSMKSRIPIPCSHVIAKRQTAFRCLSLAYMPHQVQASVLCVSAVPPAFRHETPGMRCTARHERSSSLKTRLGAQSSRQEARCLQASRLTGSMISAAQVTFAAPCLRRTQERFRSLRLSKCLLRHLPEWDRRYPALCRLETPPERRLGAIRRKTRDHCRF